MSLLLRKINQNQPIGFMDAITSATKYNDPQITICASDWSMESIASWKLAASLATSFGLTSRANFTTSAGASQRTQGIPATVEKVTARSVSWKGTAQWPIASDGLPWFFSRTWVTWASDTVTFGTSGLQSSWHFEKMSCFVGVKS